MATVEPKALYGVSPAEPQQKYFTVAIDTSGFLDTETVNGGKVSPCIATDFAILPTTIAQSLLVSRANLRWKMMMETIAVKIAESLILTRSENMSVYDPTSGITGTSNTSVTAGPVLVVSQGEIVEAITVTEVTGFAPNTSGQLASDTSLTYSAE